MHSMRSVSCPMTKHEKPGRFCMSPCPSLIARAITDQSGPCRGFRKQDEGRRGWAGRARDPLRELVTRSPGAT